jgi:hypothetical protein
VALAREANSRPPAAAVEEDLHNAQAALLINLGKRYPDTVERLAAI